MLVIECGKNFLPNSARRQPLEIKHPIWISASLFCLHRRVPNHFHLSQYHHCFAANGSQVVSWLECWSDRVLKRDVTSAAEIMSTYAGDDIHKAINIWKGENKQQAFTGLIQKRPTFQTNHTAKRSVDAYLCKTQLILSCGIEFH